MRLKKLLSLLLAGILCALSLSTFAFAASPETVFTFSGGEASPGLGDTLTFTVGITKNDGINVDTLYFKPSDNLSYVSATMRGENAEAFLAVDGENKGSYGLLLLKGEDAYTDTPEAFCTITFRVDKVGEYSVQLIPFDFLNGREGPVTTSVSPSDTLTGTVKTPDKPEIQTKTLPDAVIGKEYSASLAVKELSDYAVWSYEGNLPRGLSLNERGELLGTPEETGDFVLTVTATVGGVASDPLPLSLKVREKPAKLELTEDSAYALSTDGGVGYLTQVPESTSRKELLSGLQNPDSIKLYDAEGLHEITGDEDLVGTGCCVRLMEGDRILDEALVVVLGDTNGNGTIDTLDYQRIRAAYLGNYELTEAYLKAACVSGGSSVGTLDYQRVRAHYLGNYNIYE